jgi:DNA-binding transcriptional MerR regulator
LSAYLVESLNWRGASLSYAARQLVVSLPLHLAFFPKVLPRNAAHGAPAASSTVVHRRRAIMLLFGAVLVLAVAREFSVSLRTLRFYEDRGLVTPRCQSTARFYSNRDRARLSKMLKAKQLGFTLSEIKAMVASEERGSEPISLPLATVEEQKCPDVAPAAIWLSMRQTAPASVQADG